MIAAVAWILARTPLPVARAFAWTMALLWWWVVPIRKRLTRESFRRAFPDLPPGPNLRRMLSELILGYIEMLHEMRRPGTVALALEGLEPLKERAARGEGTLILAGHLGSWDLLGPLSARRTGIPGAVIVKTPTSAGVRRLVERVRAFFGLETIDNARGSMPLVYESLRRGRATVFVLDQRLNRGIQVPFFGRPAWTAPSLAVAAAKTRVPVYFIEYGRVGPASHFARLHGPLETTGDVARDTAAFTARIEEAIRRRPHGWLWLHDRWKPGIGPQPAEQEEDATARPTRVNAE